jgi:hypothetical protein
MGQEGPSIPGYADYQRREFCKDVGCEVQARLMREQEGSEEYEALRLICKEQCRYTT